MEDEMVIIEVQPKMRDIDTFNCEPGAFSARCNFEKELYELNQPIARRPEYLAIRDPDTFSIELIFEIDLFKSIFEKGQIVPKGKPIKVNLTLQVKNKSSAKHVIWYASFKKLLTHTSTDEFTKEESPIIKRVLPEESRVLCNGYYCIHFTYCKFFNHSPSAILKTNGQSLELR
jgi:hypothetical protein